MNPMNIVNPVASPLPANTLPAYYSCMVQNYNAGCICNTRLAQAYVPFQNFQCLYPPMKGLESGTIFPELDRPYGADPVYTIDQ